MTRRAMGMILGCLLLAPAARADEPGRAAIGRFVTNYCVDCHNADDHAGNLDLEALDPAALERSPVAWEKVVRRLAARQMPPADAFRPNAKTYDDVTARLVELLDRDAAAHPRPGRTGTFRRLTRVEYQNAVRDLLGVEIDATALLPGDESSGGFDNVTVADLSPTLLDRAVTAAQKISRLALGHTGRAPNGDTFRLRADMTQEEHVEGLPLGTRGGAVIAYTFPRDGVYEVQVRLARDRNEHVEGLREPHELLVLLDRAEQARLTVTPPKSESDHATADAGLKARITAPAGPHRLGVTFVARGSSLLETKRQPYAAHFNMHRHPRLSPAVFQVNITGPLDTAGPADSPARHRILARTPRDAADEEPAARAALADLARRAYRRPPTDADLETPMRLYREARAEGGFEAGLEAAVAGVLVSPHFLFRVEPDPPGLPPKTAYRLPDLQLASRLAFFLWSSLPDEELLDLAARGELTRPGVVEAQARRMLADPRSESLVTNFAAQWLRLRALDDTAPDLRLFPDFDDNLRQAMRRETELMFEEVVRDDRPVLDLIVADHTYLNERLAKHYGVPYVYGSRFRRVDLEPGSRRGGLLRQGSVLTVTSYATRTSPVLRGKWVLENLLGTPPPPPPGAVPALKDNAVAASLSVRERLAAHRADVACAGCHALIDPPGFALENFDAVGRWRAIEEGRPIDASGGLPDGAAFDGVDGLEKAVLKRPEQFVGALAEKLLAFALGRTIGPLDAPAVRRIVGEAGKNEHRFSSLIVGIATSTPFQMREAE